jgi:hypothetical protein
MPSDMLPVHVPQAVLPDNLIDMSIISMMKPGDDGYAVPWALVVDKQKRCWLSSNHTVDKTGGGTLNMGVRREQDGSFHVWPPSETSWRPSELDTTGLVPVGKLRFDDFVVTPVEEDMR